VSGIGTDDLARMKAIARVVWPLGRRWAPGELAWSALSEGGSQSVRFVDDAFCWLHDGEATVIATTTSGANALLDDVDDLVVAVDRRDHLLQQVLADRGYRVRADAPFELDLRRSADPAVDTGVPDGYAVRSARPDDDLVGVHRASWRPADLPFAPAHVPVVDHAATSSFSPARLAAVQADPGYDLDLHLVVETPDHTLAGSCIVWLDSATSAAAIEPLGVVPDHRHHGLARALCLHTISIVHARGADEVVIHPRGDDAYPAPRAAYRSAGFVEIGRTTPYAAP
jgi:ribosomal protein S18 acetylase RimI-like enzyme